MMTDPIADMLTRIRNAVRVEKPFVDIPSSRFKRGIADVLKREGFIWDWKDQGIASRTMDDRLMWAYGGDFGPPGTPSDGIFCANGLTQPDGKLNPHSYEVQHVYSPLLIRAAAGKSLSFGSARIILRSELLFEAMAVTIAWEVLEQC